jgi:hypothetical protein
MHVIYIKTYSWTTLPIKKRIKIRWVIVKILAYIGITKGSDFVLYYVVIY